MSYFLIGLIIGFLFGGCLIFLDHKDKVRKGMVPYIDKGGSMEWKEAGVEIPAERLEVLE